MREATIALAVELGEIARMNAWLLEHYGEADGLFDKIKLCLNEAVENIIRYGFDEADKGKIHVRLGTRTGCIGFELCDNGRLFNPLDQPEPQKIHDLETAQIGGFGIALMRDAATSLEYERRNGHNFLKAWFCEP
jgi:anti-sigma regulatory factor (Ser/Thr protein kinase)